MIIMLPVPNSDHLDPLHPQGDHNDHLCPDRVTATLQPSKPPKVINILLSRDDRLANDHLGIEALRRLKPHGGAK